MALVGLGVLLPCLSELLSVEYNLSRLLRVWPQLFALSSAPFGLELGKHLRPFLPRRDLTSSCLSPRRVKTADQGYFVLSQSSWEGLVSPLLSLEKALWE